MKSFTLDFVAMTLLCCGLVYSAGRVSEDLTKMDVLEVEIERRAAIVAQAAAERNALVDRVARLTGPVIDPELLDEQVRRVLGVGRGDEALLLPPRL